MSSQEYSASDAAADAEERSKRSEQMRRERAAEAKALIGGSKQSARSVFEQNRSQFDVSGKAAPPPPRQDVVMSWTTMFSFVVVVV